jgi:aminoglycoside phosphotransferase (APT) family kinase protein
MHDSSQQNRDERPDAVSRVGDTIRRPAGPWTSAIHALLRYLEDVGFDGAPRVLGIDDQGREVLTYVPGVEGHHARQAALHDDRTLVAVGRLIRRYHDAVSWFVPPPGAQWRFQADAPREGIVCHNDLAPVNTIYRDGEPRAFIDWEYAAPAPPAWDLACAAWSYIPLYDDDWCQHYGYPTALRGPRLRLLCDAYGLTERAGFIDLIRARQMALYNMVRLGAEAGEPRSLGVWQQTRGRQWLDAVAYLDRERDHWSACLE